FSFSPFFTLLPPRHPPFPYTTLFRSLHAQTRLLAQPHRGLFLQVRSLRLAPHPGGLKTRAQGAHHGRHRRRQSVSDCPHLVLQTDRKSTRLTPVTRSYRMPSSA